MGKIKQILYKLELEGRGIVNFDDENQAYILRNKCDYPYPIKLRFKNYKFGKKIFRKLDAPIEVKNEDGEVIKTIEYTYTPIISGECLKNSLFGEEGRNHDANIANNDYTLSYCISSIYSLLKGYTYLERDETSITRKSPLSLPSAEVTNGAVPYLSVSSSAGSKEKEEDKGNTTLHYTEVIGDAIYETKGMLTFDALEILTCDATYGRLMFKSSWLEGENPLLDKSFINHYGRVPYKKGYFSRSTETTTNSIGEYGIIFDDDFLIFLIKEQFKRILNIQINRSNAYVKVKSLKIKFVTSPLDTMENNENWIDIDFNNYEDILDEAFKIHGIHRFYEILNEDDVLGIREKIKEIVEEKKTLKKPKN